MMKNVGWSVKVCTNNLRLENERASNEWKWKASWWKVQRDDLKFVWECCRLRCGRVEVERNWKWGIIHRIQRILMHFCCCCCSVMLIKALSINCRYDALLERIKTHCKIVFCSFFIHFRTIFSPHPRSGLIFTLCYNLICQFIASINLQYSYFSIILRSNFPENSFSYCYWRTHFFY